MKRLKFSRRLMLLLTATVVFLIVLQVLASDSLLAAWQMRNWPMWANITAGVFFCVLIAGLFVLDMWVFLRDTRGAWRTGKNGKR